MPRPANTVVRTRLLLAGRDLIHSNGFNGCGVQEITARAGVPKGSFYNYFESKEVLATEILQQYWSSIEDRYGGVLADTRLKPLLRVKRFFDGLIQDHQERGLSGGCLIGNLALELSGSSAEIRSKLKVLFASWERSIAECLEKAQKRGELDRDDDTQDLAALLIEAYEGALMRAKLERDVRVYKRFLKVALPRLLQR